MSNEVKLDFSDEAKLPLISKELKYLYALNDLSFIASKLEEKNKLIDALAWKVDILSRVLLKAGINIDDYLSIDEVSQYPLREEV